MEENNQVKNTGSKKWLIVGIVTLVIVGVFLIFSFTNKKVEITGEVVDAETSFTGEEAESERMLYGTTSPWPPYIYEEDGELKGIYIEVMDRAMKRAGVEYKVESFPWPRAYKMTQTGEADVIIASHTEERELDFYYPQIKKDIVKEMSEGKEVSTPAVLGFYSSAFFIRKIFEDNLVYESPEQIAEDGWRIGINTGYGYEPVVTESNWTLIEYITEQEGLNDLADGKIEAFILDKAVGLGIIKEMELSNDIIVLDKLIVQAPIFLIFSLNSTYPNRDEVIEKLDKELIKLHESGEYDEIYREYTE